MKEIQFKNTYLIGVRGGHNKKHSSKLDARNT
jgi:hypothetical protein